MKRPIERRILSTQRLRSGKAGGNGAALVLAGFVGIAGTWAVARPSIGRVQAPPLRDELVVRVSSYGGVTWGRVGVYYENQGRPTYFRTCARRRCYFYPRHGASLLLRETPRNAKTWRFRAWIERNGGRTLHVHGTTIRLRVIGHVHDDYIWYRARVKANYYYP